MQLNKRQIKIQHSVEKIANIEIIRKKLKEELFGIIPRKHFEIKIIGNAPGQKGIRRTPHRLGKCPPDTKQHNFGLEEFRNHGKVTPCRKNRSPRRKLRRGRTIRAPQVLAYSKFRAKKIRILIINDLCKIVTITYPQNCR